MLQSESLLVSIFVLFGGITLTLFGMYIWLKKNLEQPGIIPSDSKAYDELYTYEEEDIEQEARGRSPSESVTRSINLASVFAIYALGFISGLILVAIYYPETSYLVPFAIVISFICIIVLFIIRGILSPIKKIGE